MKSRACDRHVSFLVEDCDVVIVGAGAAGLSAARTLSSRGLEVVVVEGRDRIGGRVFTQQVAGLPLPIELGAEFIHGEASTLQTVKAAGLLLVQLPDEHFWSTGAELLPVADFWEEVNQVRRKISRLTSDKSAAEFFRTTKLAPRLKARVSAFVEGYHAAHLDRISALSLAMTDQEVEGASNPQFRLPGGYDAVLRTLQAAAAGRRCEFRLNHQVTTVRWRKHRVEIECESLGAPVSLRARAAIITVPIGVLRSGAIRFEPPLSRHARAVSRLESGSIVKVLLRFRTEFWDEEFIRARVKRGKSKSRALQFVHRAGFDFSTWWTQYPVRAPLLTGWAGGEKAELLHRCEPATRLDRALDSLAAMLHVERQSIEEQLDASYSHDWIADPFSLGAYSYVGLNGRNAQRVLAEPIEETLLFAGEATSPDQTGTVAGAFESGERAATSVLGRRDIKASIR